MGSGRLALAALCIGLFGAGIAAEPRDFEARVWFRLPGVGERVVAEGQGVAQVAPGASLEALSLDGLVSGTALVPVTDPLVSNGGLVALRVAASLRSGSLQIDPFAPPFSEPALSQGALPLRGELRFCLLLLDCSLGVALPLGASSGTRGLGVGGVLTVGGSGGVRLSLHGAPFTLGSASVRGATAASAPFTLLSTGSLHGPLSFTSTAGLTHSGIGGRLALVTPTRVVSWPVAPGENDLPGFARIEIQLLPEPALLAPLLLGALLLLAARRRPGRAQPVPGSETRCDDE